MKNKKINIQFFAEPGQTPPMENESGKQTEQQQKIEFTAEQQEHINKLINSAIGKTKEQMDLERAKHEEERKRAEELAKITDEKERKLKEYELKMADYEKERIAIEKERMVNKTMSLLSEKKLPVDMAKYLVADNEENTAKAIAEFETSFLAAVSDEVNVRLRGKNPELPKNQTPPSNFSDFEKM